MSVAVNALTCRTTLLTLRGLCCRILPIMTTTIKCSYSMVRPSTPGMPTGCLLMSQRKTLTLLLHLVLKSAYQVLSPSQNKCRCFSNTCNSPISKLPSTMARLFLRAVQTCRPSYCYMIGSESEASKQAAGRGGGRIL